MDVDLELLLGFLTTREERDELADGVAAGRWLAGRGFLPPGAPTSDADARNLRHLRAALYAFLRDGGNADERTRTTIAGATERAPLRIAMSDDGMLAAVPTGDGVERAMAEIVTATMFASRAGRLDRLKLCRACGWAFLDASKNRSRIWCDMARCGAQEKMRAYRQRKKAVAET